ncbi:hypothetical protein B0H19DRAFT_1201841 [Mycena capillaripes]|nr:hypothetical protein B0H19DRAFT_1201841 [Mycena capillaripes]
MYQSTLSTRIHQLEISTRGSTSKNHHLLRSRQSRWNLPWFLFSYAGAEYLRWIGSVNTLLILSAGLVAGRLYDRGDL